jgi:hypothetical protein
MTSKAPEISSILKFVDIHLQDSSGKVYKLNSEEMMAFECFYKRHSPSIYGELVVVEKADIAGVIDFKTCTVKVYFVDLFDEFIYREFKIINIQESYNNRNMKVYNFKLRDTISYFLDNLYISKSFTVSRSAALKSIVSTYNLEPLLTGTKLKFEAEDDRITGNLVLNKNLSVLDFFEKEFNRIGYAFYQDKKGLYIKNKDNLLPNTLPTINGVFSQIATNQVYKNKIYELINTPAQKEELDKTPKQQSYYYDIKTKQMISINDNISTLQSDLTMNKNTFDMQETVGFKAKFQNRSDNAQQKNDIREQYLRASVSKLVVNGYVNNDINKIIDVELLGNKGSTLTQTEGNIVSSGKYVILSVIDKIIGDKMLQMLEVGRSDIGK